jgi:hypothetical protein
MLEDQIAELLGEAAKNVREALHIPSTPVWPSTLYDRCGCVVDLLTHLREITTRLHDATERAPQTWGTLGSDDNTPASEHVDDACSGLVRAAAEIDDAYRLAYTAWSSLSHLKIVP